MILYLPYILYFHVNYISFEHTFFSIFSSLLLSTKMLSALNQLSPTISNDKSVNSVVVFTMISVFCKFSEISDFGNSGISSLLSGISFWFSFKSPSPLLSISLSVSSLIFWSSDFSILLFSSMGASCPSAAPLKLILNISFQFEIKYTYLKIFLHDSYCDYQYYLYMKLMHFRCPILKIG